MKKWSAGLIAALMLFVLSGCWQGEVKSDMTITSEAGAGNKSLSIEILKDHVEKPDGKGKVEDNSKYFPKGMEPVKAWLETNVPEGFTVEMADEADKYVYTVSYSFSDIADYNAKTKLLVGAEQWASLGLKDASLTVNGDKVAFVEDGRVLLSSVEPLIKGVYENKDLFDPTHGGFDPIAMKDVFKLTKANVQVGETSQSIEINKDQPPATVSVEGTLAAAAGGGEDAGADEGTADEGAADEGAADESADGAAANPKTGDAGISMYVWLAAASAVALLVLFARKKRVKSN